MRSLTEFYSEQVKFYSASGNYDSLSIIFCFDTWFYVAAEMRTLSKETVAFSKCGVLKFYITFKSYRTSRFHYPVLD